jgi:hypothetical protein
MISVGAYVALVVWYLFQCCMPVSEMCAVHDWWSLYPLAVHSFIAVFFKSVENN